MVDLKNMSKFHVFGRPVKREYTVIRYIQGKLSIAIKNKTHFKFNMFYLQNKTEKIIINSCNESKRTPGNNQNNVYDT